jgi:tRNA threonylcarbamoyladenosine biosynthesis protein TsaB
MALLLHIESATENCSIAISDDEKLVASETEYNTLRHSEIITILINKALARAEINYDNLSAVSISEGPGSYTSLRVGSAAAKAICYAKDIPLIRVNTLHSLADSIKSNKRSDHYYFSLIDARRMEVYASLFDSSMLPVFENRPLILDQFDIVDYILAGSRILMSGNGAEKAIKILKGAEFFNTKKKCHSENLISLAYIKYRNNDFADIAYFSPNYIKPPNITMPKPKLV